MRFIPALALTLLSVTARAQPDDMSKVQVRAEKVAGDVSVLFGAGGNIGVLSGSDGQLIVDDQFAPLAPKIHAALQALGAGPLRWVLNTHFHGDHTGGNPLFGKEAPILAHQNVRIRLMRGRPGKEDPMPAAGLPVVTYLDGVTLWLDGEEIRIRHLPPGHTDGDSVVHFVKANVLHAGDDFFNGRFPFVDLQGGGSVAGLAKNVDELVRTLPPGIRIIPGHGAVSDLAGLKAFGRMLHETRALVETRKRQGRTLAQIQADGFPAEWKSWGAGFISEKDWMAVLWDG